MIDPKGMATAPGLRERKKAMTRAAIVETATRLFDERGYERVTTAEIADASNVSVKTLFTYFETKEDLLFHRETEFRDVILGLIEGRNEGVSPFEAIAVYIRLVASPGQTEAFEAIQDLRLSLGENRGLHARMALMWDRFEQALSALLNKECATPDLGPTSRLAATQIVALFRMLASDELAAYLNSLPARSRRKSFQVWAEEALRLVGDGVRDFGAR